MDRIDNSVPRVNVWHYEALPISDPRGKIAYSMHKLMIDSYTPLNIELSLAIKWGSFSLGKFTSELQFIAKTGMYYCLITPFFGAKTRV